MNAIVVLANRKSYDLRSCQELELRLQTGGFHPQQIRDGDWIGRLAGGLALSAEWPCAHDHGWTNARDDAAIHGGD